MHYEKHSKVNDRVVSQETRQKSAIIGHVTPNIRGCCASLSFERKVHSVDYTFFSKSNFSEGKKNMVRLRGSFAQLQCSV